MSENNFGASGNNLIKFVHVMGR